MFKRIKCMIKGHVPHRRKVTLIAGTYYGTCTRCGARVRRVKRNHWVMVMPWVKIPR